MDGSTRQTNVTFARVISGDLQYDWMCTLRAKFHGGVVFEMSVELLV